MSRERETGWGETAGALWRGEVNVMGGSAVYEVLLLLMMITVRTDTRTDQHTKVKTVSASFTPFTWRI